MSLSGGVIAICTRALLQRAGLTGTFWDTWRPSLLKADSDAIVKNPNAPNTFPNALINKKSLREVTRTYTHLFNS